MDILARARRRAFSHWLRTGRLPDWARAQGTERKYNPWHDPDDGRFTFKGTGRYFGRGNADGGAARMHERPADRGRRPEPFGGYAGGGDAFTGGAGGSFDLPGDSARRQRNRPQPEQPNAKRSPQATLEAYARRYRQTVDNPRNWRRVEANGYIYHLDSEGRTRRVSGRLTENLAHRRSRSAQTNAGRPDRRPSDEGGHYIARRFNGPTEAFNHFAQDTSFNRSDYKKLENEWGRAIRAGKRVDVTIEPTYERSSRRPSTVSVSFWIDGVKRRMNFPNEPRERTSARR